jgi:UDP-glucose 6-dehydrogenase
MKQQNIQENLPKDVASLQKELAQERLRNKLLTAIIDVAEEELKIPIRKKYGTKPLKK